MLSKESAKFLDVMEALASRLLSANVDVDENDADGRSVMIACHFVEA